MIQDTPELRRISGVPRRRWTESATRDAIGYWTHALRTPRGTMTLLGVQAQALSEIHAYGGFFGPIPVGHGKTLISFLAPIVGRARNPLLLTRAALIPKTKREMIEMSKHWAIAHHLRVESYETLGREKASTFFERMDPDMVIPDECHRLKNRRAGVTLRVIRHLLRRAKAGRRVAFCPMSGTATDGSINDYDHLIAWAVPDGYSPLPYDRAEVEAWALSLDPDGDATPELLAWYRERFLDTPGVIVANEEGCHASLLIRSHEYDPGTDAEFAELRKWRAPDGFEFTQPTQVWSCASTLALGFWYVWSPRPPDWWLEPRKAWAKYATRILEVNRRNLDTFLQVTKAVAAGLYGKPAQAALEAWQAVRDEFEPNKVAVWVNDRALRECEAWGKPRSIVWSKYPPFGEELARRTGWRYYGELGLDREGRYVEAEDGSSPIILSIDANLEGRNLQHAFDRNLVTTWPGRAARSEQLIGRTHRLGQRSDEVTFDVFVGCFEHANAFDRARSRAARVADQMGQKHKLTFADIDMPSPWELSGVRGTP